MPRPKLKSGRTITEKDTFSKLKKLWISGLVFMKLDTRLIRGIPDVIAQLPCGASVWIELKVGELRHESGTETIYHERLRLEQAIFLDNWRSGGGLSCVLIDMGSCLYIFDRGFRRLVSGSIPTFQATSILVASGTITNDLWNTLKR